MNDIEPNEAYDVGIMWLSTYVNMFWLLNHVVVVFLSWNSVNMFWLLNHVMVFFYEHQVALF